MDHISIDYRQAIGYLPTSKGEQISGNRHFLLEAVCCVTILGLFLANRQATSYHRKWRLDVEIEGTFDIRSILAWENGPCVNSLALRN